MRNISSNNFIICLGDDVRYRFAQELMPEGQIINSNSLKINKSYIFINSNEENVITDDKKIIVYTSKIQPGRILEFPVSGIDIKTVLSDQGKVRIGKVVIFADFPYKKENLRYLIEKVCRKSKNADVHVVLYNEKRRAGYTDIEKSEKILTEAYNEFGMFGVKISDYFSGDEKQSLFAVAPKNYKYFQDKYIKELKGSQYRIENRFDIHYKTFLERTYEHYFSFNNPEEFKRFLKLFEYGNIPENADDIWKVFTEGFKEMYLYPNSDIMTEIADFYLDYISEIMRFRLKSEQDIIKKACCDLFDSAMVRQNVIAPVKGELEYKEVLNKNNVVTEFTKRLEDYFHVYLRQMLYNTAVARINSIINAIN